MHLQRARCLWVDEAQLTDFTSKSYLNEGGLTPHFQNDGKIIHYPIPLSD